uniref:Uncharacterized protein n=1 Tax=Amphimedon queenslandica TaxID=400682 RepID=A0A1X7SJK8_AMPQE
GSLYVGLRLVFQDGGQIYNFLTLIALSSYVLQPYKWLKADLQYYASPDVTLMLE